MHYGSFRNHYLLSSVSSSSNKSRQRSVGGEQKQGGEGPLVGNLSGPMVVSMGKWQQMRTAASGQLLVSSTLQRKLCADNAHEAAPANSDNDSATGHQQQQQHQQQLNAARQHLTRPHSQPHSLPHLGSVVGGEYCATSAPEAAAATAMVTVVRLILVILICVLLVKLRAPKSARRFKWRAGKEDEDEEVDDSQLADDNKNGRSESANRRRQQQQLLENSFDSRILSNLTNNHSQQHEPIKRRASQPELMSGSQSHELRQQQQPERRRRHSDTSLAHLKLPPGPMGLPFLGYLPFVGHEIHLTLTTLSERYGPIYQIFLGGIRVVVLNDASLVRQAFKQPVFSGRPDTQLTRILQGYGIVNSDGALWKEQRAFLHTALRKLGAKSLMSGSNGLEAKIQNQVKEFVNDLSVHASEGKPCQVRPIVARAVSSVVGSIVMNLTYRKYEEKEKFDRLIELMQEGFRLFTIAMPLDFIPIFRFLPGVSYAYKKMKKNRAETSAFFQGVADEHRKYLSETFNLGAPSSASSLHPRQNMESGSTTASTAATLAAPVPPPVASSQSSSSSSLAAAASVAEPVAVSSRFLASSSKQHVELENIVARDLVDAYIVQQKKHEKDGKENYFSDQQLVQIMSDIFSAGLETVTSTIEWSILFLILNTECQEQIQREIDRVIGRDRMPQLEDLSQMPYTEATIYEVLRRSNVVALGNAHATLDDATIGGYLIPKGTQVLPNLYGIHMNPQLWDKPDRFDPTRFIVNDKAKKPDYFIPFSVGRRMCLGDVLAKMEVFLFLVGLLQKYDLSVADEDRHCPPQVKGTIGVSNTPASFRVALRVRSCHNAQPCAAAGAQPAPAAANGHCVVVDSSSSSGAKDSREQPATR